MNQGTHRLLQRQLKRYVGDTSTIPPDFLAAVNHAYHQADDDRHRIERALEISSQELLQANTNLQQTLQSVEQQVGDRTAELSKTLEQLKLAQIQLIQAEKMSSLGQVAAGIAHEINNPVTFIHGNLRYLEEYSIALLEIAEYCQKDCSKIHPDLESRLQDLDLEFISQDIPKIIHSMGTGTERIKAIVQDLRTFSRLDEAEVKTVQISQSIESTIIMLNSRLKAACGQAIEIYQEHKIIEDVECYVAQVNQVFFNIITNAIDALSECSKFSVESLPVFHHAENTLLPDERTYLQYQTSPKIWILSCMLDANTIEIRVIDNGVGIASKIQAKLFDPFFTTKPVGKGTGMGLSTSHQIIANLHQGKLECRSALGLGTVLAIQIPLRISGQLTELTKL